jgi:pimeloyl-ACP methyl ester carboxylesterase
MDTTTVQRALDLARGDGEFLLNAVHWTGSLTLFSDDDGWRIAIENGTPTRLESVGDPAGAAAAATADDPVIISSAATWQRLLGSPPPSGYVDFAAADAIQALRVLPPPASGARHLAVRRIGDLLRHSVNGTPSAARASTSSHQHGQFEQAVGRYVHLEFGGLDHRVYFEEAGSGIPLVCQHTAGADGRQFRHFLEDERITSKYRVVVYDMPYHGKSLPPEGRAWWAEQYVLTEAMAMALPVVLSEVLGLDRPVFIGSSVGGMLALDLARHHADDFRAVISLEGGLRADFGLPDDLSETPIGNPDPAVHAATMMMIMSPTAPEASRQETRLHYAQGAPGVFTGDIHYYSIEHDLRGQGHLIDTDRCAVHLLTGEYDFPTVPWTELAAKEIPGASMQIMEGLGHFPMAEDHEGLMRYVQPILDSIAADTRTADRS